MFLMNCGRSINPIKKDQTSRLTNPLEMYLGGKLNSKIKQTFDQLSEIPCMLSVALILQITTYFLI